MKQSDSITKLAGALHKAQSEMGGAVKDSNNPFFKSKYADLTSVIKAIKKPFADNGLSFVQFPITTPEGAGVVTRLMHVSGEWLQSEFTLPLVKRDPQAAGSALTYARRYALAAMVGIPAVDDDAEISMARNEPVELVSIEEIDVLLELIDSTNTIQDKFMKAYKVDALTNMTIEQYRHGVSALKRKLAVQDA